MTDISSRKVNRDVVLIAGAAALMVVIATIRFYPDTAPAAHEEQTVQQPGHGYGEVVSDQDSWSDGSFTGTVASEGAFFGDTFSGNSWSTAVGVGSTSSANE